MVKIKVQMDLVYWPHNGEFVLSYPDSLTFDQIKKDIEKFVLEKIVRHEVSKY